MAVLHDVHILAVVRVLVKDVPGRSPKQAIKKAQELVNLNPLLNQGPCRGASGVEYNDEIIGFILDAKDGDKVVGTGVYDINGKPTVLDRLVT